MRRRLILTAVALAVAAAGIMIWRGIHAGRPRYVIARKELPAPPAKAVVKKEVATRFTMPRKFANPKVAIVMDDFGYNMNNLDALFAIGQPVTLSILPNQLYSAMIAGQARERGYETILHLPLEPQSHDIREEANTICSAMTREDVLAKLGMDIESVGYLDGVSNHMGSKATEDGKLMRIIMAELKKRGLFFFDSLTSERSVCREAALAEGVRYGRRDIFLDNSGETADIEKQLALLKRFAFRKGRAIAVCHDRKNTVSALARKMPGMSREGVRFVRVSELVK